MSVQPDFWIRRMALEHGMIEPFAERQVRQREGGTGDNTLISFGVSSYGYDLRVSDEFKVFTNVFNTVVDPKHFDEKSFVDMQTNVCIVPPNSFALARSVEYFRIPRNILTICLGKSTYARCGIIVNVTPLEPEWEGPGLDGGRCCAAGRWCSPDDGTGRRRPARCCCLPGRC